MHEPEIADLDKLAIGALQRAAHSKGQRHVLCRVLAQTNNPTSRLLLEGTASCLVYSIGADQQSYF